MKIYSLILCILTFTSLFIGIYSTTLTVKNNCPNPIWPGIVTTGRKQTSSETGFILAHQASTTVQVPRGWHGRVWARTECTLEDSGRLVCATGHCGGRVPCNGAEWAPPATLAQFSLGQNGAKDSYDISLEDGFNLPVSIKPQGGSGPKCGAASCAMNVNSACPPELAVKGSGGKVVGCNSACAKFGNPNYCCEGQFGKPETCGPTSYSKFFKQMCPQAYSYAFDDKSNTLSCEGGPNYLITFCP